jgi:hypothetical protein
MFITPDRRQKAFFGIFCASFKKPLAAVNIEFHNTLVSHFQQEGLASFLVRNIGSFHDLIDLERLFAQSTQNFVALIEHAFFLIISIRNNVPGESGALNIQPPGTEVLGPETGRRKSPLRHLETC